MSPESPAVSQIAEEIREVALLVHSAQERHEERDLVVAAHEAVARIDRRYREVASSLSDGERLQADRTVGRRLTDIKRLASLLPRAVGVAAGSTPDRMEGGGAVGERRITGVSWQGDYLRAPPPASLRVGGELESWCGKCGGLTTHHIAAMVGAEPRQVICQVCNSRHTHRTEPARKSAHGGAAGAVARTRQEQEAARRDQAKAEAVRAAVREIQEATEVRPFDPKERYKAGEFISHPDFGRGKIENVLRSSLVVRFTTGLKSLILT